MANLLRPQSRPEHAVRFDQNVKKQSDHQNMKKQSGAKGSALSSRRMRNDEIDWIFMDTQKSMWWKLIGFAIEASLPDILDTGFSGGM